MTLADEGKRCVIRLEGEVGIAVAAELKTKLVEAMAAGKQVHVELEKATDLDVTALQLLWAAAREAEKAGNSFTVAQVSEDMRSSVRDLGFEDFPALGIGTAQPKADSPRESSDGR